MLEENNLPVLIAARGSTFIHFKAKQRNEPQSRHVEGEFDFPGSEEPQTPIYEHLRRHCAHMHRASLSRLHLQMALYVHPVVRGDELATTHRTKVDAPQSRHLAEAELRSVYTMFIKALVSPKVIGRKAIDQKLFKTLGDIMHVTSRELDRYSGQLRQFIVDDKG